jgi:hypothetical protein
MLAPARTWMGLGCGAEVSDRKGNKVSGQSRRAASRESRGLTRTEILLEFGEDIHKIRRSR